MYPVLFERWLLPLISRTSNFSPSYLSFFFSARFANSRLVLAHCGHSWGGSSPMKIKPQTLHCQDLPGSALVSFASPGAVIGMLESLLIKNRASRTETSLLFLYTGALSADRKTIRDLFFTPHKARAHFTDAESDSSFLIHNRNFLLIFLLGIDFPDI